MWGKKGTMDRGSDFKHFEVGSVLDVVLFADMLDDRRYETTSLCPRPLLLPLCHNVSVSCPRDLFPLSVLVSYFDPPRHPFLSTYID